MFLNTLSGFSGNIMRKEYRWNTYVTIIFLFLEIKTLQMLNARSSHPVFWNIFLKFSGKYLWRSPTISKLFNRSPENRFNNRQCTTHIEQLIDALSQFMSLYFLYQNGFFTISGNPQNCWLQGTTLLGKPLMECSLVFSFFPRFL